MNREFYIYWRVAADRTPAAAAAMTAWQAALCERHPGLQARLLLRADGDATDGGAVQNTLMETYAIGGGIGQALHSEILVQGAQAAAAWCQGLRHVEVFDPVSG